jgi:RNA polymerase sigma-70 factor (ECF subfamily)
MHDTALSIRLLNAREHQEDMVQDTFLAATESLGTFEGRATPRTWLIGTLRHKIMDRLRRKTREEFSVQDSALPNSLFDEGEHW